MLDAAGAQSFGFYRRVTQGVCQTHRYLTNSAVSQIFSSCEGGQAEKLTVFFQEGKQTRVRTRSDE